MDRKMNEYQMNAKTKEGKEGRKEGRKEVRKGEKKDDPTFKL